PGVRGLLAGVAMAAGAVLVSAVAARLYAPTESGPEGHSDYQEREAPADALRRVFAFVWPPRLVALSLSGLRVWSAPSSAARTQALTLWGAVQALNAIWMALGPRRLGGRLSAATASLGAAAAYVWRARRVDAASYAGWVGLANALGDLRR